MFCVPCVFGDADHVPWVSCSLLLAEFLPALSLLPADYCFQTLFILLVFSSFFAYHVPSVFEFLVPPLLAVRRDCFGDCVCLVGSDGFRVGCYVVRRCEFRVTLYVVFPPHPVGGGVCGVVLPGAPYVAAEDCVVQVQCKLSCAKVVSELVNIRCRSES